VLAALIIDAVVLGMIDIGELRRLYRVKRFDFWIAIVAIVAVLSAGVLAGVIIGVALSLLWLVYVTTAPSMPLLGRQAGTQVFREHDEYPDDETFPGLAVVRMDSGLFFATADALHDRLREITQGSDSPVHAIVLDFEGVDFVDSQGSGKLKELHELAQSFEVTLRLARVKTSILTTLDADGLLDELGGDKVHGNVFEAVEAQRTLTQVGHQQGLDGSRPLSCGAPATRPGSPAQGPAR
jgi:MFS superfamily sulfate permease-like transporter